VSVYDTLEVFMSGLADKYRDDECALICRYLGIEPDMCMTVTLLHEILHRLLERAKNE